MGAHTGFTIILWVAIGLFVFNKWENRKKKRKQSVITFLRKGKVIFWNVSESEMFDIMEDLAVECYYNKSLTAQDITYEPYIEEPLNNG